MYKSILISIVIAPVLLGTIAAKGRNGGRDLRALRLGWLAYAVLWIAALYYVMPR